ncbi:MAG: excinuclease ABC subunit B [Pseudomonadota bacterium]
MRLALLLSVLATPAFAWDFTPRPVCTIWHEARAGEMKVTYDPSADQPYAIAVTLADGAWPATTPYTITFQGMRSFTIATDRHQVIEGGATVLAEDTGFDNVLNGLEFGLFARPALGRTALEFPLAGAAEAVAKFRDCTQPGLS